MGDGASWRRTSDPSLQDGRGIYSTYFMRNLFLRT